MRKIIPKIVILLFLVPAICQATVIQIGFAGLVDSINDPYNLLENGVQEGASISGFYIYDSETPDSWPLVISAGSYLHTTTPYGISATIGGLTFQTDPTDVDFRIGITNGSEGDLYIVSSYSNLELDNGLIVSSIGMRFDNFSGTVFSSDALPQIPLDLSQWQYNYFGIHGGGYPSPPIEGNKTVPFSINGHVDSVWLIPEPATMLLLCLGGLLLRKRS